MAALHLVCSAATAVFSGGVGAVAMRCTRPLQGSARACTARHLPGVAASCTAHERTTVYRVVGIRSVQACSTRSAPLCGRRHDKQQRHKVAMHGSCAGRKAGAKTLNLDGGLAGGCAGRDARMRQCCTVCMRCAGRSGSDAIETANRAPSCAGPGAIAALACLRRVETGGPDSCFPFPHSCAGSSCAHNQAPLADGACGAHAPSGITLRRPVRRACQRDTAASRPGPESPGRPTG